MRGLRSVLCRLLRSGGPRGPGPGVRLKDRSPLLRVEINQGANQQAGKWWSWEAARTFAVRAATPGRTITSELGRRAAARLIIAGSGPAFALVGFTATSSPSGIITPDDRLEGICWRIREAVRTMQEKVLEREQSEFFENPDEEIGLEKFTIGPAIAKGSNAVVYAARKAEQEENEASGGNGPILRMNKPLSEFPLAVKMMFNYDAESNTMAILRAMYRELVPARVRYTTEDIMPWEDSLAENTGLLPAHPNIVSVYCGFADRVPSLPGSMALYPDALPERINPWGSGRNMSLFLVMKRYDLTLKEYLNRDTPDIREAVMILAQILEAVRHMNNHGIAHRDLKTDNILVELEETEELEAGGRRVRGVVVSDFGCCLADANARLTAPFPSIDTDRGGNAALMAPEVATARPGLLSYIDYSKSDCWAVGAIGYELMGGTNPFCSDRRQRRELQLYSHSYTDSQLPPVPPNTPPIIARLLHSLLARSPSNRPGADLAATICQLYLWAPNKWLNRGATLPSSDKIVEWMVCLATKVLCHPALRRNEAEELSQEQLLMTCFLSRATLTSLRTALLWITTHP